jgi:glycosyltransferase involved in cell wall biosynthesis
MSDPVDVLQATAWYPPHHMGGTEVYLTGLVAGLSDLGVRSRVLVPSGDATSARYTHAGAEVMTYPARDGAEAASLDTFEALLRAHPDAIYHQHAWTPDCGPDHLHIARRLGLRTILTVHTPNLNCLRGTMMLFGAAPCDGEIILHRCGACWAQGRGAPRAVAQAVAHLPVSLSRQAGRGPSRLATALGARAMVFNRLATFAQMTQDADHVVAVCGWLQDALGINGIPPSRLLLSRQGVSGDFLDQAVAGRDGSDGPRRPGPLRLLYLGRWHPVKGVDVVVRAIRAAPKVEVELTIHAVGAGPEEDIYRDQVRTLAGDDARIRLRDPLPRDALPGVMRDHDALVIPSTWMETGPLVALEAQAVGLYVLGSRLGGIAELVDETRDGQLVAAGDVPAWTAAIKALAESPPARASGPPRVRSMRDAASDMARLYGLAA